MRQITENIYIETDFEGTNVGAIITQRGIIAIDAPSYPRQARDWAMQLHTLSSRPIQFLVLTDATGDRALNSRWMNAPIVAQKLAADTLNSYDKRYPVSVIDNLAMRNPARSRELSNGPVEKPFLSFSKNMHIYRGGCEVILIAAGGPTKGNTWVHIPKAGVLFAGDTVVVEQHPLLYEPNSHEWIASLHELQTFSRQLRAIVSGRGEMATHADIEAMIAYLEDMQESVWTIIKENGAKAEVAGLVSQFAHRFPSGTVQKEWLHAQIRQSLEHVYDEIQLRARAD